MRKRHGQQPASEKAPGHLRTGSQGIPCPDRPVIAERHGVNRTYVARMLQLTALAPEFVQAVLAGTEPSGKSLTKLRHGVPVKWDAQGRLWSRA